MGQKLSEHPAVDWWVKLTREADATGVGHKLPVRGVSTSTDYGRWELDRFATMQRLRNRSSMAAPQPAGPSGARTRGCSACVRCGRPIGARSTKKRLVRQVWGRGTRTDYYECGRCY